jgi:predicted transcriptional regulator
LGTVFGYVLIYILDASVAYRIDIGSLPSDKVAEAATAYRALLEQHDCRIVSEKKDPGKKRVTFIFRTSKHGTYRDLQDLLETQIDGSLKGSVNWEID